MGGHRLKQSLLLCRHAMCIRLIASRAKLRPRLAGLPDSPQINSSKLLLLEAAVNMHVCAAVYEKGVNAI